ncbi:MAG: hypothetical protein K6T85_07255 [Gorillibacterium sp.]|nr:hypothetical protein [Gorillibacterium sp.]
MKAWETVQSMGMLADLKEQNYRTTLLACALAELLIEKSIATREEITEIAARLERADFIESFTAHERNLSNNG